MTVYEFIVIRDDGETEELLTDMPHLVLAESEDQVRVMAGQEFHGHASGELEVLVRPFLEEQEGR